MQMPFHYHRYDLPDSLVLEGDLAIDTEAMGLRIGRDRLCLVQLCDRAGSIHLVHFPTPDYAAPRLRALLMDESRVKIFHFARFDLGMLRYYLECDLRSVFCTKMASKLARTYSDQHGLKDLCREYLGVTLSKQQTSTDWGAPNLTKEQQEYAASDVVYLHRIFDRLMEQLERLGRVEIAKACSDFLTHRVTLDLMHFDVGDIFSHHSSSVS